MALMVLVVVVVTLLLVLCGGGGNGYPHLANGGCGGGHVIELCSGCCAGESGDVGHSGSGSSHTLIWCPQVFFVWP